jgi:hypothetical protein
MVLSQVDVQGMGMLCTTEAQKNDTDQPEMMMLMQAQPNRLQL